MKVNKALRRQAGREIRKLKGGKDKVWPPRYQPWDGLNPLAQEDEVKKVEPTGPRKIEMLEKYFRAKHDINTERIAVVRCAMADNPTWVMGPDDEGGVWGPLPPAMNHSYRAELARYYNAPDGYGKQMVKKEWAKELKLREAEQVAIERILSQMDTAKADQEVASAYIHRFMQFLRGKPVARDAARMRELGFTDEQWFPAGGDDVIAYLRSFSAVRAEYLWALQQLKMKGPGTNLRQMEIYFKYIVDSDDLDKVATKGIWQWLDTGRNDMPVDIVKALDANYLFFDGWDEATGKAKLRDFTTPAPRSIIVNEQAAAAASEARRSLRERRQAMQNRDQPTLGGHRRAGSVGSSPISPAGPPTPPQQRRAMAQQAFGAAASRAGQVVEETPDDVVHEAEQGPPPPEFDPQALAVMREDIRTAVADTNYASEAVKINAIRDIIRDYASELVKMQPDATTQQALAVLAGSLPKADFNKIGGQAAINQLADEIAARDASRTYEIQLAEKREKERKRQEEKRAFFKQKEEERERQRRLKKEQEAKKLEARRDRDRADDERRTQHRHQIRKDEEDDAVRRMMRQRKLDEARRAKEEADRQRRNRLGAAAPRPVANLAATPKGDSRGGAKPPDRTGPPPRTSRQPTATQTRKHVTAPRQDKGKDKEPPEPMLVDDIGNYQLDDDEARRSRSRSSSPGATYVLPPVEEPAQSSSGSATTYGDEEPLKTNRRSTGGAGFPFKAPTAPYRPSGPGPNARAYEPVDPDDAHRAQQQQQPPPSSAKPAPAQQQQQTPPPPPAHTEAPPPDPSTSAGKKAAFHRAMDSAAPLWQTLSDAQQDALLRTSRRKIQSAARKEGDVVPPPPGLSPLEIYNLKAHHDTWNRLKGVFTRSWQRALNVPDGMRFREWLGEGFVPGSEGSADRIPVLSSRTHHHVEPKTRKKAHAAHIALMSLKYAKHMSDVDTGVLRSVLHRYADSHEGLVPPMDPTAAGDVDHAMRHLHDAFVTQDPHAASTSIRRAVTNARLADFRSANIAADAPPPTTRVMPSAMDLVQMPGPRAGLSHEEPPSDQRIQQILDQHEEEHHGIKRKERDNDLPFEMGDMHKKAELTGADGRRWTAVTARELRWIAPRYAQWRHKGYLIPILSRELARYDLYTPQESAALFRLIDAAESEEEFSHGVEQRLTRHHE
jgi:hypothetical protein